MAICGPKCSLCGMLLSIWGVIQLSLMGVFYYIHAVALAEDLAPWDEDKKLEKVEDFYSHTDKAYEQNAFNCWITAGLYLVTLIFSSHQFWLNTRSTARI